MKMDGHTHTQLCAHGSGEKTEKMIEKAIRLGFTDYCITEHAPLPAGFETSYEGMFKRTIQRKNQRSYWI